MREVPGDVGSGRRPVPQRHRGRITGVATQGGSVCFARRPRALLVARPPPAMATSRGRHSTIESRQTARLDRATHRRARALTLKQPPMTYGSDTREAARLGLTLHASHSRGANHYLTPVSASIREPETTQQSSRPRMSCTFRVRRKKSLDRSTAEKGPLQLILLN